MTLAQHDRHFIEQYREEDLQRELASRCKASFRYFVRQAWPEIEQNNPLLPGIHIDAICEHLQAVADGRLNRLLINIAPGHGKSTLISTLWPAWMWTRHPEQRWLCASYSLDLATRDNRNCKVLVESEWYQSLFGDVVKISKDQKDKRYFENTRRGYRMATAVRGSGTGKRGSHLLIDDPNNAMAGLADIQATREWFGKTWASRLNDPDRGAMVVVGQRLHEKDLSGHILELGDWEHLNLPTEFEPERKCYTSIGWADPRTQPGEMLWPARYDEKAITKLKRSLGSIHYAAQYQQSPVPSGGAIFKRQWFRYFTNDGDYYTLETSTGIKRIEKKKCKIYVTVDLAISLKEKADYTVISVWAITPDKELLLLDVLRERLEMPDQKKALRLIYQQYEPVYEAIENVAYQLAIIQELRAEGLPIKEYKPVKDKVARASTASVFYEGERVFHLKNAAYLIEWEPELLVFPMGEHDDQVDTAAEMCDLVSTVPTGQDHIDYAQQYKMVLQKLKAAQTAAPILASERVAEQQRKEDLLQSKKPATDFLVDTGNPVALDRTLQAMPSLKAFVLGGGGDPADIVVHEGHHVVRVMGDPSMFKFVCERQGYCRVIKQLEELLECP